MPFRPLVLVPCLILSICFAAHSQVMLGVEAGPTFPRLLNILQGTGANGLPLNLNSQSVTRFTGSFFLDVPIGKQKLFTFRPQLQYLGAGGETPEIVDFNGNALTVDTKYALNYINLPLQLLFSPSTHFGKCWFGGGFYPGMLLSATAKTQSGTQTLKVGNNSTDDLKQFDFGFKAEAGITFKCGLLIGGGFQQGLTSIAPSGGHSNSQASVRNAVWSVHLAYEWKMN